jgi:hypothetical protein
LLWRSACLPKYVRQREPRSTNKQADDPPGDVTPVGLSGSNHGSHNAADHPAHPGEQQDSEEQPRTASDDSEHSSLPTGRLLVETERLIHGHTLPG